MSRVFVTGDTHGKHDIGKLEADRFPEKAGLTRDDYVIVCGDWGAIGWDRVMDQWNQDWWKAQPFTCLWIDGNHEGFTKLESLPVETWNGGKIHRIADNIIHLMRGQVFEIGEKSFYTMGGADSIDKGMRRAFVSWWPQEIPSYAEIEEGFQNLEKHGNCVNYVLTHEGPKTVVGMMTRKNGMGYDPEAYSLNMHFDMLAQSIDFDHWFFGHHHFDTTVGKYTCCYQNIYEIRQDGGIVQAGY